MKDVMVPSISHRLWDKGSATARYNYISKFLKCIPVNLAVGALVRVVSENEKQSSFICLCFAGWDHPIIHRVALSLPRLRNLLTSKAGLRYFSKDRVRDSCERQVSPAYISRIVNVSTYKQRLLRLLYLEWRWP